MKKFPLYCVAILLVSFIACSKPYKYNSDPKISNNTGAIADSTEVSYIIDTIVYDGQEYTNQWNIDTKNKINKAFRQSGSPLLYNFYLNRSIIRIVKLDNDTTSIIDINKDAKNSWLASKVIKENNITKDSRQSESLAMSIQTFNIDNNQWNTLDSLTQKIIFSEMNNLKRSNEMSDMNYFIEYHSQDQYFYILSESKNQDIQNLLKCVNAINHRIKI